MVPVKTVSHNGYTINLYPDEDAESPREWDNAAVLVCFHRRYELGDNADKPDAKHNYHAAMFSGWNALRDAIIRDHNPVAIEPLGLIDHSGISIYIGDGAHWCDPGGWDSGQIGWAYVTRKTALYEWGKRNVTRKVRDLAEAALRAEVEVYDQYLRNDVYGYVIVDPSGDDVNSCWGFFGTDGAIEAATQEIDGEIKRRAAEANPRIPADPIPLAE